jgi:hypothetical protein
MEPHNGVFQRLTLQVWRVIVSCFGFDFHSPSNHGYLETLGNRLHYSRGFESSDFRPVAQLDSEFYELDIPLGDILNPECKSRVLAPPFYAYFQRQVSHSYPDLYPRVFSLQPDRPVFGLGVTV